MLQRRRWPDEVHLGWSLALLEHHIVSNAMNVAIDSFQWPSMIGYNSIERYIPLLKLYISVSAILQRRRWPDEVQFGMAATHIESPYRISRCEYGNPQLLVTHDSWL